MISLCAGEPSQGAPSDVRRRAGRADDRTYPAGLQRDLRTCRPCGRRSAGHYRRWYDLDVPSRADRRHHRVLRRLPGELPGRIRRRRPGGADPARLPRVPQHLGQARLRGGRAPLRTGRAVPADPELLDAALRDGPVAGLVLASPANPTGTMVGRDQLADLADWCRDHGVRLISDEIYHGIVDSYGRASSSAAAPGSTTVPRWRSPRSPSTAGMTGWRLGWALVPEDLVDRPSTPWPATSRSARRFRPSTRRSRRSPSARTPRPRRPSGSSPAARVAAARRGR